MRRCCLKRLTKALYPVALPVRCVVEWRVAPVLGSLVASARDNRLDATAREEPTHRAAAVAPISDEPPGPGTGLALSGAMVRAGRPVRGR